MENLKMLMVCMTHGEDCEQDGYVADVGNETHLYCCEEGFKQSLKDFQEYDNQERTGYQNN